MHIFYFLKTKISVTIKIAKSDYISKTKNRTKKSFMQKMSAMSIPVYPGNLSTSEVSCNFGFFANFGLISTKDMQNPSSPLNICQIGTKDFRFMRHDRFCIQNS